MRDGQSVGGLVLRIDGERGELELLFTDPAAHGKGVGYAAWCEVERLYPQVRVWETCTPYFETRNIHFYINKCGFHAVEFFNAMHPDPRETEAGAGGERPEDNGFEGMFRFEKAMW